MLMLVVAFALATDYEVFVLARIKEAHDHGLPTREAIALGIERTGTVFCVLKMALLMASGTMKNPNDSKPEEDRPRSLEIFERGKKTLVGGVDSPVRAFRAVGGTPLVIDHAKGARLFDVDGREYIDFVCSWGALILGHADPDIVSAISDQASRGTSFGMTSPLEIELGEKIATAIPSVEMVRFVNSGTEAAMSAVRLARAFIAARSHRQIRRLLPWPLRRLSFRSRLGPCHARHFRFSRCSGRFREPHPECAVQRFGSRRKSLQATSRTNRGCDRRTCGREYGSRSACSRISRRLARHHQKEKALLIFDEVITGFRISLRRRAKRLQNRSRSHSNGENYRRRPSRCSIRRQTRHHGAGRAARSRLSGRYAFG